MLMSLGLFPFELSTAPFETLKRASDYSRKKKPRVGKGPASQWTGPEDDTITVEGTLAPEITGGKANLDKLRAMAATGKTWILTAGTGEVMGQWYIARVEDTHTHLLGNGLARKIAFTLTLSRDWDDDPANLGNLVDSKP